MQNQSELARVRVQIDLELDALELMMHGTAIVANHAAINHNMEQLGKCGEELAKQIGEEAANAEICEKYSRL